MSNLDLVCEICGRSYRGEKCIRCTQTAVGGFDFSDSFLNPTSGQREKIHADAPTSGAALKTTDNGRLFYIAKPLCRIGQEGSNDIVLGDEAVSKFHAQIAFRDGEYILRDLGTKEGTWLNGQRVEQEEGLFDGDYIKIAGFRFYFVGDNSEGDDQQA